MFRCFWCYDETTNEAPNLSLTINIRQRLPAIRGMHVRVMHSPRHVNQHFSSRYCSCKKTWIDGEGEDGDFCLEVKKILCTSTMPRSTRMHGHCRWWMQPPLDCTYSVLRAALPDCLRTTVTWPCEGFKARCARTYPSTHTFLACH